jgi:hypothetical protein
MGCGYSVLLLMDEAKKAQRHASREAGYSVSILAREAESLSNRVQQENNEQGEP